MTEEFSPAETQSSVGVASPACEGVRIRPGSSAQPAHALDREVTS